MTTLLLLLILALLLSGAGLAFEGLRLLVLLLLVVVAVAKGFAQEGRPCAVFLCRPEICTGNWVSQRPVGTGR